MAVISAMVGTALIHFGMPYHTGPDLFDTRWNLRDWFKANRRTLVALGPSFKFPAEIANDVISLDMPMPTDEELTDIIKTQVAGVDGLKGLAPTGHRLRYRPSSAICAQSARP